MTIGAIAAFAAFARRPVPAWDQPHFRVLLVGRIRLVSLGVSLIVRAIKGHLTHSFAFGVLVQAVGLVRVDSVLLVLTSKLRDNGGEIGRNAWLLWRRNLRLQSWLRLLLGIHDSKHRLHIRGKLWHRHHWGRLRLGGLRWLL